MDLVCVTLRWRKPDSNLYGAFPVYEFAETGVNEKLGYNSPADIADHYPHFYWNRVQPYIGDALRYLGMTMEGKQWTATLYSHIFAIEHNRQHMGPQAGLSPKEG